MKCEKLTFWQIFKKIINLTRVYPVIKTITLQQGFLKCWQNLRGPWAAKRPQGGPWGLNLKLTLDILELIMKRKKKVLGVFNGSFISNPVGGGYRFFNFLKGGLLKKNWETLHYNNNSAWLKYYKNIVLLVFKKQCCLFYKLNNLNERKKNNCTKTKYFNWCKKKLLAF